MEITIFAKRRQSKDNKTFYQYLTTLPRRDGTTETMRVCFRDCDIPKSDSCPRNIVVEKANCNISTRVFTVPDTGEIKQAKTLWVTRWDSGSEYVDHSMDEYDID